MAHLKERRDLLLVLGYKDATPKGVEHLPYANEEAHVLLFEPKAVINTSDTLSAKTVEHPEWI